MKNRIKIVHIITRMDRGGSAQNTLLTCEKLCRTYDVVLAHGLSLESKMTSAERNFVEGRITQARRHGLKDVRIPSLVRRIDPVRDIWAFCTLWAMLVREKPTIVHTHTYKAGILGSWAAKLAGVPVIIHTPHGHIFFGHFSPALTRFFMMIERVTAGIVDRMVALTEGERRDYIACSVADADKMVTIHSGVDVERYMQVQVKVEEKRRSLGLKPEGLVVGTVGWLLPIKGPMYLLKAMGEVWKAHPRTSLVYVGKGDLERKLKQEASRMGAAEKVWFLGWRDDVPEILPIMDIFVLSSLNEGMGRVLVEAMAAGRPLVASNVGGIPDLVSDGENGLLVPPADPKVLAHKIVFLISNPDTRRKMGEKGRERAVRFGTDSMVQKIEQLYLDCLQKNELVR
jgi:glycosyltransferase involved in cell wall biosynthesis